MALVTEHQEVMDRTKVDLMLELKVALVVPLKVDSEVLSQATEPLKEDLVALSQVMVLPMEDSVVPKEDMEPLKVVSEVLKVDTEPLKADMEALNQAMVLLKADTEAKASQEATRDQKDQSLQVTRTPKEEAQVQAAPMERREEEINIKTVLCIS